MRLSRRVLISPPHTHTPHAVKHKRPRIQQTLERTGAAGGGGRPLHQDAARLGLGLRRFVFWCSCNSCIAFFSWREWSDLRQVKCQAKSERFLIQEKCRRFQVMRQIRYYIRSRILFMILQVFKIFSFLNCGNCLHYLCNRP